MGLIVNFSDFENISATGLSPTDYVIGYRPGPNREIRSTIEEFFIYLQTLSSNNVYVAVSPNSAKWNSTYSTVNSLSDTWEESVYITPLQVASASWDSVYSTVKSLSDTWEESVYITPLQVASASWDSVYSTVKSLSDTWEESVYITPLQVASASWDSVYSTVNSTSSRLTTLDYLSTSNVLLSSATISENVGIGTNPSNNKLTVNGNISANGSTVTSALSVLKTTPGSDAAITVLAGNASGDAASIFFGHDTALSGRNRGQIRYFNGGIEAMAFSTSTQEAMRIRANGNMGIGVTSPGEKLTVSGNISARDTVIADALSARYLGLVHIPANDGIDPSIRMGETGATGFSGVFISYNESTNVFGISSLFSPAPAVGPAIAIDRNSNVGIGTDTPEQKLHVLKASAGTVTADTNSIAVFEGGGNAHISILTPDAQTGGVVFGSPGDIIGSYLTWNYSNSALKLATASPNGFIQLLTNNEAEAVRITSSGNVGIATTTPVEKLTVSGNVSASGTIYATNIITNVSILSTDSTVITIDNSNFNTYFSKILHVRSASNTTINFETSLPEGFNVMILNETTYNVTLTSTTNNVYLSFGNVLSGQQGAKQLYSSASVYKYGNNVYATGRLV